MTQNYIKIYFIPLNFHSIKKKIQKEWRSEVFLNMSGIPTEVPAIQSDLSSYIVPSLSCTHFSLYDTVENGSGVSSTYPA
jgi:hypothetical protein